MLFGLKTHNWIKYYIIHTNYFQLTKALEKTHWVDKYTRAVVVEFFLYQGNVNLFAAVNIYLEFPAVGGVEPWLDIQTLQLVYYWCNGGLWVFYT